MSSIFPTEEYDPTDPWGVKKRIRQMQGPPEAPAQPLPIADKSISGVEAGAVFSPREASSQPSPTRTSQTPGGGRGTDDPMAGIYQRRYVPVPEPGPFDNMHGTVTGIIGGISRAKRQAAMDQNAMEERRYQDSLEEARLKTMHADREAAQRLREENAAKEKVSPPHSRKTVVDGVETWQNWNPETKSWETDTSAPVGNKPSVADEDFKRWHDENPKGTWTQYMKWKASLNPAARADYRPEPRERAKTEFENYAEEARSAGKTPSWSEYVQMKQGFTHPNQPEPESKTLKEVDDFEQKLRLANPRAKEEDIQAAVRRYEASVTGRRPPKPVSMGDVKKADMVGAAPAAAPAAAAPARKATPSYEKPAPGAPIAHIGGKPLYPGDMVTDRVTGKRIPVEEALRLQYGK